MLDQLGQGDFWNVLIYVLHLVESILALVHARMNRVNLQRFSQAYEIIFFRVSV